MKVSKRQLSWAGSDISDEVSVEWVEIEKGTDIIRLKSPDGEKIFDIWFMYGNLYIKNISSEMAKGRTSIEVMDKNMVSIN